MAFVFVFLKMSLNIYVLNMILIIKHNFCVNLSWLEDLELELVMTK